MFDYTNTPAYRRMKKRERARKAQRAGILTQQGPITVILIGIIDFAIDLAKRLFGLIWSFSGTGFRTVSDIIYGPDGADIIPNTEKFGQSISMRPFRLIITILIPPLGVFLSKGLYGWFNVLFCFALTWVHFVLGAIYALVITHRNRYADRYEEMEGTRLRLIKEYVRSCTGDAGKITDMENDPAALVLSVAFFVAFMLMLWAIIRGIRK